MTVQIRDEPATLLWEADYGTDEDSEEIGMFPNEDIASEPFLDDSETVSHLSDNPSLQEYQRGGEFELQSQPKKDVSKHMQVEKVTTVYLFSCPAKLIL
jgi:hypothetical protein